MFKSFWKSHLWPSPTSFPSCIQKQKHTHTLSHFAVLRVIFRPWSSQAQSRAIASVSGTHPVHLDLPSQKAFLFHLANSCSAFKTQLKGYLLRKAFPAFSAARPVCGSLLVSPHLCYITYHMMPWCSHAFWGQGLMRFVPWGSLFLCSLL